ncbi:MAG TPA: N-acetylneuraminate synthase [Elusimicrobiota bacterium]|nr:N-acetylneuraminate synthase [Elusimicrobiota bacterium]
MTGVFIIAEAGVNHNGSITLARRLVEAARRAGADAVKFQSFHAESLATPLASKVGYQKKTTSARESQLGMLKRLELSSADQRRLAAYCRKKGILFLSSPFDSDSLRFLASLRVPIIKVPSGEITNKPYLREIGALGRKVILSTGMSTLGEVRDAVRVIVRAGTPRRRVTLLHCTTEYPAPFSDVNLRAMLTMKKALGGEVGYSDHTAGYEAAVAAAALGARVIEKHMTLDRRLPGPDHAASLEPDEFSKMVMAVRNVERALGTGDKKPAPSERANLVVRKSIVARRDIVRGERFTPQNLTTKRPGTGLSPMRWDAVIGTRAKRDFRKDELIRL